MHHQDAASQDSLPPIYDIISADYDVSPSCRFSHAPAHMQNLTMMLVDMTDVDQMLLQSSCLHSFDGVSFKNHRITWTEEKIDFFMGYL